MIKKISYSIWDHPFRFGIIFLMLIPTFATIYYLLPEGNLHYPEGRNIVAVFYFSTVTVTTLGYGDVSPISQLAQAIAGIEAIFGLVTIGFFLNDIARRRIKSDELQKEEERKFESMRQVRLYTKILAQDLKTYLYHIRLMLTAEKDELDVLIDHYVEEEFDISNMTCADEIPVDIDSNITKSKIYYYFKEQHELEDVLQHLIFSVDLKYWPKLETLILKILENCRKNDAQEIFLRLDKSAKPFSEVIDHIKEMIAIGEEHEETKAFVMMMRTIRSNIILVKLLGKELTKISKEALKH